MDGGDDESATARGERDRRKRWRDDDNIEDPPSQATQLGTQDSMQVDTVVLDGGIVVHIRIFVGEGDGVRVARALPALLAVDL